MTEQLVIRKIQKQDDPTIAVIIRNCLEEFGANKPGTVYYDKSTDNLSSLFEYPRSHYFIAEYNGAILGGGGIFPSDGLPVDTCELVKMYLTANARGKGIGAALIKECMTVAAKEGFKKIYIETMPELKQAIRVYEKFGFEYLKKPLGNTGHFGCDVWMLREI
ncbi:MAG: GNAT family N-acetyltransferase [bacterium]|jgi:putative acetyltransferase